MLGSTASLARYESLLFEQCRRGSFNAGNRRLWPSGTAQILVRGTRRNKQFFPFHFSSPLVPKADRTAWPWGGPQTEIQPQDAARVCMVRTSTFNLTQPHDNDLFFFPLPLTLL